MPEPTIAFIGGISLEIKTSWHIEDELLRRGAQKGLRVTGLIQMGFNNDDFVNNCYTAQVVGVPLLFNLPELYNYSFN